MLDYLIASVRRNIQTRPLRWALVLILGALWLIFAAITLHATFGAIFGAG